MDVIGMNTVAVISSAFQDGGSGLLVFVAVLGATTLAIVMLRRTARRGGDSPRAQAREQVARLRRSQPISDDVRDVMLELDNLARHIHGQIDTRYRKLETVIGHADRRIAELERLVAKATPRCTRPDGESVPTVDVTIGDDMTASACSSDAKGSGGPLDREAVYAQADQGQSTVEIARTLGVATGAVELILSLGPKDTAK